MDKLMEWLQTSVEFSFKWGTQDPVAGKIQAWVVVAVYLLMTGQGGKFVGWASKYFEGLVHAVV